MIKNKLFYIIILLIILFNEVIVFANVNLIEESKNNKIELNYNNEDLYEKKDEKSELENTIADVDLSSNECEQKTQGHNMFEIAEIGEFSIDDNKDYYSQIYTLKRNIDNLYLSISIDEIINAPEGSYIVDESGNQQENFQDNEIFKIMIPKIKIDKDYNIKIKYSYMCNLSETVEESQMTELTEYTQTYEAENKTQIEEIKKEGETSHEKVNEAENKTEEIEENTVQSQFENADLNLSNIKDNEDTEEMLNKQITGNSFIELNIDSHKSHVEVNVLDSELHNPIEGVKISIKYKDGETIGDFISDEEGKIIIDNMMPGTIMLEEIETIDNYIASDTLSYDIDYNSECNILIYKTYKIGTIEIVNIDKDSKSPICNTEFELIDENRENSCIWKF